MFHDLMDTLAHGLWAAAAAKTYNLTPHPLLKKEGRGEVTKKPKLNVWLAAFWGFFPDVFAFAIPFSWLVLGPLFGDPIPRIGPPASNAPSPAATHWAVQLAATLYNYSHSFFIFSLLFAAILIFQKYKLMILMRRLAVGKSSAASPSMVPRCNRGSAGEAERVPPLGGTTRIFPTGSLNVTRTRIPWELLGWPLHILMDIPTHSFAFFPTPFLWPFSDWKFNGIAWATPWFMILNYSILFLTFLIL